MIVLPRGGWVCLRFSLLVPGAVRTLLNWGDFVPSGDL